MHCVITNYPKAEEFCAFSVTIILRITQYLYFCDIIIFNQHVCVRNGDVGDLCGESTEVSNYYLLDHTGCAWLPRTHIFGNGTPHRTFSGTMVARIIAASVNKVII